MASGSHDQCSPGKYLAQQNMYQGKVVRTTAVHTTDNNLLLEVLLITLAEQNDILIRVCINKQY